MKTAILAASAALVLVQPALAERQHVPSAKQMGEIRALITGFMTVQRAPGATFAIGLSDKVVWTEGFGFADVEDHVRATPDTAYRTASIGKSMTATAVMELVEQGKLDLDAPIQKYCPRFPEKPWPITARKLLCHQSGIVHYSNGKVIKTERTYPVEHPFADANGDLEAPYQLTVQR